MSQTDQWDGLMVVAPERELRHPMWTRMFERAGQDPTKIPVIPLEQFMGAPKGIHTLIPLGEAALRKVADADDLFRWRGRISERSVWGARVLVAPTLLPSQMLPGSPTVDERSKLARKPTRFQGAWIHDIQHALRLGGVYSFPELSYLEDPSATKFEEWAHVCLSDLAHPISFDIETHYKINSASEEDYEEEELQMGAMLRISFAYKPHNAVSVAWSPEYYATIRALLESPNAKVCWNGAQFDVPKLRDVGYHTGGRIYDYQDGWHLLQSDQPKGLEYVSSFYTSIRPWKHLNGARPALYSCIDADAALQNALGIERELKNQNMWQLFEEHVVDLMPILDEAGRRGNVCDTRFGDALKVELEIIAADTHEKCQSLVPHEIKPRKRYKKRPKDLMTFTTEGVESHLIGDRCFEPVKTKAKVKRCSVCKTTGVTAGSHFKGGKKNPCKAAGATLETVVGDVLEWDEILPFNPNSADQFKSYALFYGHRLGKDRKTGNESLNTAVLEKLVSKYGADHPIYKLKFDYAKVAKTLSTYIYTPDEFGYIHTSYVNAPSTWRLASRHVNLQNVGKRAGNKWAKMARRQIVARPGHVFVQADSTSIEAVVMGWLIEDPNFIAVAKKSIHAYLACQDLEIEFTDAHIELVKSQHKKLYDQFKTAVYLLLYGGDPYLMHMTNTELFPTKEAAQEIQDKIYGLLPKLKEWQERTREQAKKDGVLMSPWGYKHYFYDVYTFKRYKNGEIIYDDEGFASLRLGQDAKRALAFKGQNCAGAFCRDTLRLMGMSEWRVYMPANVSVHDGYTLEVPLDKAEGAQAYLVELLTRPIPQMGNIRIGCEVDMGSNWADADPDCKVFVDGNPEGMKTLRKVEV